jgi:hypothetical protein
MSPRKVELLPATKLGTLEVTRLVMGGNPISGFSHGSRDREMTDYFTTANIKALFRRLEKNGINTVFLRADRHIMRVLREYWNEGGTLQWVAQSAPEWTGLSNIDAAKAFGAKAIYLHGGSIDGCFEQGDFESPRRQLEHVREIGLPVGVASHVPDNIRKVIDMGWEADFFMICLYNIPGYRGKLSTSQDEKFKEGDRAKALALFKQIDKPCAAYKILAAGRCDPRQAFEEVCTHIKPIDLINVGMYPPDSPKIVEENATLARELLPR